MKNIHGIVLIELIVVLIIIAMLAAIMVPLYNHIERWSLRTAATELAVNIRETRHTAITTGKTCFVIFYWDSRRYKLDYQDKEIWVRLPKDISYAVNNFPQNFGAPTLSFRFTGAPNQGGHVSLKDNKGNRLYVIVTPVTGRVRIDDKAP